MKLGSSQVHLILAILIVVFTTAVAIYVLDDRPVRKYAGTLGEAELYWTERIRDVGGSEAYADFANDVEGQSPARQHELAHAFGAALFANEDTAGLPVCDARFSYGCFHEFLGRAIAAHGLSVVDALNQGCIDALVESPLSCQHGIGHGILAYLGYDEESVRKTLDECSSLPYSDPIGGCYGGAFMEYNLQTMLGSQARIRGVSQEKDVFEPCKTLPAMYQNACAFWQPQWWHSGLLGGAADNATFNTMGTYCVEMTNGDESLRRTCFEGIGNIVPPAAGFNGATAARLCDASSDNELDRLYCRSMAANSLGLGGSGLKGDGEAVCLGLKGAAYNFCISYANNVGNILNIQEAPEQ